MAKKYTSTILLFAIFIGFLIWGGDMLYSNITATTKDGEAIIYSLMLIGCGLAALYAILILPRRKPSR